MTRRDRDDVSETLLVHQTEEEGNINERSTVGCRAIAALPETGDRMCNTDSSFVLPLSGNALRPTST